ncbi:MAG: hypothetical protein ACTTHU_06250 [Treponema sp.]
MKNNPIKNLKIFSALAMCLAFVVISGCKNAPSDDSGSAASKSSENKIIEFGFKKADNAVLSDDVKGRINGNTISIEVPSGTDKTKLKASFEISSKAQLLIGNTVQKSGETENDFSDVTNGVMYTVKAEDGSEQKYTVKVYFEINVSEFGFKKADNAVLSGDVKAVIGTADKLGNVIAVKFPAGTLLGSLTNLRPYFLVSGGVKLYLGSTMLESGITQLDFSNIWNGDNYVITAKAEDGGEITFKCFSEIAFPVPSTAEIEKYQGSYYGKIHGRGDVIIVIEKAKVTVYSKAMSVDYENVEWIKNPNNSISCRTYNKGKEKVSPFMLNRHDFTDSYVASGKTYPATVSASIMKTPIIANKGTDFTWTEGSGYKAVGMHS